MSNDDAARLAARLLVLDFAQRAAAADEDTDTAATFGGRVEKIVEGVNAGAVLRAVLELLAATDTVDNRRALVDRCRALAYLDADVLEDQARGHRHPGSGVDR